MQEHGVPVTFAYISDAHDNHGNSGNIHVAYGPGEAGYVQQLHDYDKAFGAFFARLAADGINKNNTLFVFTVDEGDHGASTPPDARRATSRHHPVHVPTNGHVTEVNGDLKRLVATYNASHGTTATTSFSVHADLAPNVYVTGNPARASSTARDLEKAMSDMQVTNLYSGNKESLFVAMADPVEEKTLHMVTADPARTPTFTPFAQGDYFLNASSTATCTTGGEARASTPASSCRRRRPRRASRGTTAASSPRSPRPGSGWSGRRSSRAAPTARSGRITPTSGRPCSACSASTTATRPTAASSPTSSRTAGSRRRSGRTAARSSGWGTSTSSSTRRSATSRRAR